jgi:hypothetical protein
LDCIFEVRTQSAVVQYGCQFLKSDGDSCAIRGASAKQTIHRRPLGSRWLAKRNFSGGQLLALLESVAQALDQPGQIGVSKGDF